MSSKLIPLAPVDAAWYHMDRPANEALVTSITITSTPISLPRLRALIERRVLIYPRFRQRVVEHGLPVATPHWQLDPAFSLDAHLHHVGLPDPADRATLLELVGDLATTGLNHERPLWQMHLVDRVDGGSALVLRYHHCLADGTAMMALAGKLFDAQPGGPEPGQPRREQTSWLAPLFLPAQLVVEQAISALGALELGVRRLTDPGRALAQLSLAAGGLGTAVASVVKSPDPQSPLKGRLSGRQRVAYSDPVPLPRLKALGHAAGATVNDLLIAAMSGALRQYLVAAGADPAAVHMRAVVPVDLRSPERALELGNVFGLTFLDLPTDVADPLARLARASHGMRALKHSPEANVFLNLLALFGQTPKAIEDIATELFGSKATLSLTNVRGPEHPLYLAGSKVEHMLFFVPHPTSLGLGVSLLSYNDEVVLGVISDAAVVAEPAQICGQFVAEIASLQALLAPQLVELV